MSASISLRKRAWVFAIAGVVAALPVMASAAPILRQSDPTLTGPFGLATKALADGPLTAKWRTVERAIEDELKIITRCRTDRATCASRQALQFLKIVDDASAQTGLARVGEINRAFNLAIRPMSDQAQYGVEDVWTSPLATLASGAGDCEDYAIAKLVALREAGVSSNDLRLLILRNVSIGEDHAVVAARVDGRWRMLDNRYFLMIEDSDVTKLQPVFAIDANGATRFEQPSIAVAALPTAKLATPVISVTTEYDDTGLSTSAIDPQITSAADSAFWQTRAM